MWQAARLHLRPELTHVLAAGVDVELAQEARTLWPMATSAERVLTACEQMCSRTSLGRVPLGSGCRTIFTPSNSGPACRVMLTWPQDLVNIVSRVGLRGSETWQSTLCRNCGSGPSVSRIAAGFGRLRDCECYHLAIVRHGSKPSRTRTRS